MRDNDTLLTRYRPLFSVTAEHGYFADTICRGLRFEPCAQSDALLQKSGCVWRAVKGGIAVHADVSKKNLLRACFEEFSPSRKLGFVGYADDALFNVFTGGYQHSADTALFLDSDTAILEPESGRLRLHAADTVSDEERRLRNSPSLFADRRQGTEQPKCEIWVKADIDMLDETSHVKDVIGKHYYLRFAARATLWHYVIVGDWAKDQVSVVDLTDKVKFNAHQPRYFANGRAAQTLRSAAAITMQEHSSQRFQLRVQDHGTERVIVKRLPVASADQFSIEEHQGAPTWVSEIYVNC
jgi:hypothetical protein